jgi:hypothetical protein
VKPLQRIEFEGTQLDYYDETAGKSIGLEIKWLYNTVVELSLAGSNGWRETSVLAIF